MKFDKLIVDERRVHMLYVSECMYGFSLKNKDNVHEWDKPPIIQLTIDTLRCLYDIITFSDKYRNNELSSNEQRVLFNTEMFIDGLEKHDFSGGDFIYDYMLRYDSVINNTSEDYYTRICNIVNKCITDACEKIDKHMFEIAYESNEYVRKYMKDFYGGLVYKL